MQPGSIFPNCTNSVILAMILHVSNVNCTNYCCSLFTNLVT
ncbi:hypothetical protein Leryth_008693, partial [Lithospermum erythrorhizon]